MKRQINLIGLGPGTKNLLTDEAKDALDRADIVFGAKRILETAGVHNQKAEQLYQAEEIFSYLKNNPQYKNASVVFSGDIGFFSGANGFYEKFRLNSEELSPEWELYSYPGLSSAVYFAGKLRKSWQDWKFLSLHGAKCNTIGQILVNRLCFFILSGAEDVISIGKKLSYALENQLLAGVKCWLGQNLSYPDEKICEITVEQMCAFEPCHGLFVLLVENPESGLKTQFLNDEDFIREEKIPMTKKEVRILSISSLALERSSVVYDIGCGTGSITVETARAALEGHVFAVECKEEALELAKHNAKKFCLENVTFVHGSAPECLKNVDLPAPTHVFIGGSRGNLREMVNFALQKNPSVKIVANFVTFENLCEMQSVLQTLEDEKLIKDVEISQISVSRAEKAGNFHLMKAQNPVFIVSFSGRG